MPHALPTTDAIVLRLRDAGYLDAKMINQDRFIAMRSMLNGFALVRGSLAAGVDAETFWYSKYQDIANAFAKWTGIGHPEKFVSKFTQKQKGRAWDHPVRS